LSACASPRSAEATGNFSQSIEQTKRRNIMRHLRKSFPLTTARLSLSLAILLLAACTASVALAQIPDPRQVRPPQGGPQLPSVQDILNQFFGHLAPRIEGDDQLPNWLNEARDLANKTASNFEGCPSDAAQGFYNGLKNKRERAIGIRDAAERENSRAESAERDCQHSPGANIPGYAALCRTAYNGLPFRGIKDTANSVIGAIDYALAVLRGLRCVRCTGNGSLAITVPTLEKWELTRPSSAQGLEVCTRWEGNFSYSVGTEGLSAQIQNALPRCTRKQRINFCDWDITLLVPELKRLNIVPPNAGSVRIESIPTKRIEVITGLRQDNCREQLRLCTRVAGSMTVPFDTGGDPVNSLRSAMASIEAHCQEQTSVACTDPPFGLTPVTSTIDVPDYSRVRISWETPCGPSAAIEVDLTQQNFHFACKATCAPPIPGLPVAKFGQRVIRFPFICANSQTLNVVEKQ